MKYTDKLIAKDPFEYTEEVSQLFLKSMEECVRHHYKNSKQYSKFCDQEGFSPEILNDENDLEKIPIVFVNIYKHYYLKSIEDNEIELVLTSSGTGGQKSQIVLDKTSLERVKLIARKVYDSLGMVDDDEIVNCIIFNYDPSIVKDLGTAFTDELLTSFTKTDKIYYAFVWDYKKNDFIFNIPGTINKLLEFEAAGLPVRLLGFPAFILEAFRIFEKRYNRKMKLNPDSFVMTGGGWKTNEDKKVEREVLRKYMAGMMGIKTSNIRDLLGMVEHGIPYVECKNGKMHIPVYGRVSIRDTITMKKLDYGEME
ncbi:hypothetical protein KAJ27_19080, partial [bacterium]|nr:hypothetical protein [bacterium]